MGEMQNPKTQGSNPKKPLEKREAPRMPLLFRCLFIIMLTLSLVFFATKLVEYNRLRQETDKINEELKEHENNAAELRYLIDSPVDDAYIIRIAREKLGLVFPDEEIFYNNLTDKN